MGLEGDGVNATTIDATKHIEYNVSPIGKNYKAVAAIKAALIEKETKNLESIGVARLTMNSEGSLSFYIAKRTEKENDAAKSTIDKIINSYLR